MPSNRGELEISDLNNFFLHKNKLEVIKLGKKIFWSDTGTFDSLFESSKYFQNLEIKTGKKTACIEEIAFKKGYINKIKFLSITDSLCKSNYVDYLQNIANEI